MNEIQLQRLVEGECDDALRAELLRGLGDDFVHWRTLALAMLEAQVIRKHLLVQAEIQPKTHDDSLVVGHPFGAISRWHPLVSLLTLAASIVFVLCGFYFWSGGLPSQNSGKQISQTAQTPSAQSQLAPKVSSATSLPEQSAVVPVGQVVLVDDSGQMLHGDALQAYGVDSFVSQDIREFQLQKMNELNARLHDRGLDAELKTQFYQGRLDDGREMIVPYNVVYVKPRVF